MASEVYIKYTVDTADLQKAQIAWDKLTQEEQESLDVLKKFGDELQKATEKASKAGKQMKDLGSIDSLARLRDKAAQLRRELELLSPKSQEFASKLKDLKGAEKDLNAMSKATGNVSGGMGGIMGMAGKLIPILGAAFSAKAIMEFGQQAVQAAMKFGAMQRGLEAASGGSVAAGRAMDYVRSISERLGTNLLMTGEAYKSFAAAGRSAGLEINAQEKIFESVSEAGMKMGLTTDQIQGSMLALTQMLSKGTVQAEELRGQLGERIPGAFGIMARAIGVSEKELGKMLEKGEVIAKDVLPLFAEELNKTFGGGNQELIDNTTASTSRLDTAWSEFLVAVGQKLEPAYKKGLEATASFINGVKNIISDNKPDAANTFTVVKAVQRDYKLLLEAKKEMVETALKYEQQGFDNLAEMERARIPENMQALSSLMGRYMNEFQKSAGMTMAQYQQNLKVFQEDIDPEKWTTAIAANNLGFVLEYRKAYGQVTEIKRLIGEEAKAIGKEFSKPAVDPKAAKKAAKEAADAYSKALAEIASQEKIAISERKAITKNGIEEEMKQQEDLIKITIKFNKQRQGAAAQNASVPQARRDAAELVATQKETAAELERVEKANEDKRYQRLVARIALNKANQQADITEMLQQIEVANQKENDLAVTLTTKEEEQSLIRSQNDLKYAQEKLRLLEYLKKEQIDATDETYTQVTDAIKVKEAALAKEVVKFYDTVYQKQDEALQMSGAIKANYLAADQKRDSKAKKAQQENDLQFRKSLLQNEILTNEKRIENADENAAKGSEVAAKAANLIRSENEKLKNDLGKIDQEIYDNKAKVALAAVDLVQQTVNQSFDLYKNQLDNELDAANKKFDEELRLADGNKQKLTEIEEARRAKEAEIKKKQFEANRIQAIANVVFSTAPIIAQYGAAVFTAPLALIALAAQAAQIAFILAQPVPEFAEGTKGKKFKGGKAIVGERGTEMVVTESGQVYYTPPTATLLDLPKGSQVIPNHLLSQREIAYATNGKMYSKAQPDMISGQLSEIGSILKGLPIHQITMDEKGFQKFIKTETRTTKVLNNKFPNTYS
jgi:tape measure domain-containing protein